MPTLLPLLLCGIPITFLLFLWTNCRCREALRNNWRSLSFVLLLALVWRLPFDGHFFYGLEYGDSYIYAVAGRYLDAGLHTCASTRSCYLTTICAVGSSTACMIPETFSGHFIGYPSMIAAVSGVLGYKPTTASYLSLIASLIAVVLIFLAGTLIDDDVTGLASSLVFSLTPAFAVYGVATYAEPISNLLLAMCVLLCVCLLNPSTDDSMFQFLVNGLALALSGVLALTVKRENVLLIPIMPNAAFKHFSHEGCRRGIDNDFGIILRTNELDQVVDIFRVSLLSHLNC
jgi:hypothetical protein